MNREEAKTKDKTPAREKCLNLLNRNNPVFPAKSAKGLGMIAGSVHARMWELCLEGKANRIDFDGEWGYYRTKEENIDRCAKHYQAEQAKKDLKKWRATTDKILPHLPLRLQVSLKAVKDDINQAV